MKGDFSRETFNPKRHYSGVLMQQGRVQLDADWNEQGAIGRYRAEVEALDVIGPCGAPQDAAGFEIAADGGNLTIGAGRYYVDGILCENDDQKLPYDRQPDLPDARIDDVLATLGQAGTALGLVYLDVWQRHVTALDDPLLRETALGGPDTTTRIKTVWQVKVLPVAQGGDDAQRRELVAKQQELQGRLAELQGADQEFQSEVARVEQALAQLPENARQRARLQQLLERFKARIEENRRQIEETQAQLDEVTAAIDRLPAGSLPTCASRFPEWDALATASGTLNARSQPAEPGDDPCELPPSAGYRRLENQLYRVEVHDPGAADTATFKWSRDNGTVVTSIEKIGGSVITVHDIGPDETLGFANGQWIEITDDALELNGRPGQLAQIDTVNAATREITLLGATPQPLASNPDGVDAARHPKLRRWDQVDQPGAAAGDRGVTAATSWVPLEDGISVQFGTGSYRTGDYWLIPARTATAEIEWPPFETPNASPVAQPPRGIRHHYCRLALLRVGDGVLTILDDCRQLFPPLTAHQATNAMHVTGTSWRNDDLLDSQEFLTNGLRIMLDRPPDPQSVSDATVIVTAELPYRAPGTETRAALPFNQTLIVLGNVAIDPANPNVIVWAFRRDLGGTRRLDTIDAVLAPPLAATTRRRFSRAAIIVQPAAVRLRVTLKGAAIWSDTGQQRLYLDGQALGQPGVRADGQTGRTALIFPSGGDQRAGDFESWFYVGQAQRQSTLQVNRVRFLASSLVAVGERVVADVAIPAAQPVTFAAQERVGVVEITFSRAVKPDGFNPGGQPQSVRLVTLANNEEQGHIFGDLSVGGNVARFIGRDPSLLGPASYRLIVLGQDIADRGPAVRAEDDSSPLDGNADNQAGDDFTLDFTVGQ